MSNIFIRAVMTAFILFVTNMIRAQEHKYDLGLDYATEMQSDFGKKINWVNLLSLEGQYNLWANGELSLQAISIRKTRKERIADDLQTFSNIEEDNLSMNLFLAGYTHSFKNTSLFAGVRNVNNDYFIGDYTSLFTNSSCGIYPTLSINFPIANYPLSAMCIHGEFALSKTLILKNSLYNGTAYTLFSKEGSLFTVHPKNDGFLNVIELSHLPKTNNHELYNMGSVLYVGHSMYRAGKQEETKTEKKKINYALWGSMEKSIYSRGRKSAGILLQGSFAPAGRNDCKYYYGAGIILNALASVQNENSLGVFYNRAVFHEVTENTIEVTWRYKVNKHLTLQPVFHCIKTGSRTKTVGVVRLYCNI